MVFENSIVLGTVKEFIDYALVVVAILAVVYFVRFLLAVREEKAPDRKVRDAEWEARGAAGREWIGKKYKNMRDTAEAEEKKRKEEKEKKHIRALVSPLVDKIYNHAKPLCHEIKTQLSRGERAPALSNLKELRKEVHSLFHGLNSLRHAVPDDKKDQITNIMDQVSALVHVIETDCISELPSKTTDPTWATKVTHVKSKLDNPVKPSLDAIYSSIKAVYA